MSVPAFERLLATASSALDAATLSVGLAPCVAAFRQARVAQAFRDAAEVAITPAQRCSALLALCSAYLTFSRLSSSVKQQLSYVEEAFSALVEANIQEVSARTAAPYKACMTRALEILADPEADLNCGLSFWSRLIKSVPRHWQPMLYQLSMNQAKCILHQGLQCMAADACYKTGLKCGHEATGPVELATQCAHSCRDSRYIYRSEQLRADIYTFIRCTRESVQVRQLTCCPFLTKPLPLQLFREVKRICSVPQQLTLFLACAG